MSVMMVPYCGANVVYQQQEHLLLNCSVWPTENKQFHNHSSEKNNKINEVTKILADRDLRIEELEQQLQALTTIEQHIQQRDKTGDD